MPHPLRLLAPLLLCALACPLALPLPLNAQSASPRSASPRSASHSPASQPPIPNAATLLRQVVAHQRQMDSARENYTYRELQVIHQLDRHGHIQSTKTREYRVFFVHTHQVDELIAKDGHPLSPDQQRNRVQHAIAKAEQTPPGQSTSGQTVSVSQLLAIMRLSHPRRTTVNGRPTIVFDFTGKRHAPAHSKAERTLRKITGAIWIDERDHEVSRLTAHFDANFHEGWGLVAVDKGSTFTFTQRPMHGGLWLPSSTQIHLVAHALAFIGYRANITVTDSHYQVFHAGAKQLKGVHIVPPNSPK